MGFLHNISDMLVYSVSPLNSIIGGWMKTKLKNKKNIINDRLYQEVTQNMEKLNLTQLQIGRISLDSLKITQPLTEENSELKTRISLIKNKICITFQLESRNMLIVKDKADKKYKIHEKLTEHKKMIKIALKMMLS